MACNLEEKPAKLENSKLWELMNVYKGRDKDQI